MLAAVIAAAFVVMGATAVRTASAKEPAVELAAGTVIYDSTCTPIQLTETTLVSRENGVPEAERCGYPAGRPHAGL